MCSVRLLALTLGVAAVSAHAAGFDGERFSPATGAAGGLWVERALTAPHLRWSAGAFFHFADDLVLQKDPLSGQRVISPVRTATSLDLFASIGLFDRAELGIHLPLRLAYSGDPLPSGATALRAASGLGDLRLVPKFALPHRVGTTFSFGLAVPVSLPTGSAPGLRGGGGVSVEPMLVVTALGPRWIASANGGFALRSADARDAIGHAFTWGISAAYALIPSGDWVDLTLEVTGAAAVGNSLPALGHVPIEALAAVVAKPLPALHFYAGGGLGLSHGIGAPDARLVVGMRYTPLSPSSPVDTDRDDIPDSLDRCQGQAEDRDGFEDGDGCPDQDDDKDGIADDKDECPEVPEEQGGDGDGCPDAPEIVLESGHIHIRGKVQFPLNSAELLPKNQKLLDQLARLLRENPDIELVQIEGHTDNTGENAFNQQLSEKRAEVVKQALVERGVDPKRLVTKGFGKSRPIAPNDTEAGRAKNRRVELKVLE